MSLNGKAARPGGEWGERPSVSSEKNLAEHTKIETPAQERYQRRPLCRVCFYFHPINAADPLLSGKGECWRYPPRSCPSCISPDEYPLSDEGGYCGEFVHRDEMIARFDPATQSIMRRRGDGR